MSADLVDDLHCAEDEIGSLTSALTELVAAYEAAGLASIPFGHEPTEAEERLAEAVSTAQVRLAGDYCRPSCYGRFEDDPDPWHIGGACDDCCGCPCHKGE